MTGRPQQTAPRPTRVWRYARENCVMSDNNEHRELAAVSKSLNGMMDGLSRDSGGATPITGGIPGWQRCG